jgi:hypothetical protein
MTTKEEIFDVFHTKASTKQDVVVEAEKAFAMVKDVLKELCLSYAKTHKEKDHRVVVEFNEVGTHELRMRFGGDVLLFHMHTNIFNFDEAHSVRNTSYVKEDEMRAYCGVINIYNFLNDSFKYDRKNDLGFLISRIFVNKEGHFFVEGKKKLNTLYRDFMHDTISKEAVKHIVEQSILYALDFDLQTPAFQKVELVSIGQMEKLTESSKLKTAKRLGFRMSWENEEYRR